MNESLTLPTKHLSPAASLAAIGVRIEPTGSLWSDPPTGAKQAEQPLVEAAETTLQLDAPKRARTIIRVDAGAGTRDDLNWLLARGYEVVAKECSGPRIRRWAGTVIEWIQDPTWSERSCGLGERA